MLMFSVRVLFTILLLFSHPIIVYVLHGLCFFCLVLMRAAQLLFVVNVKGLDGPFDFALLLFCHD